MYNVNKIISIHPHNLHNVDHDDDLKIHSGEKSNKCKEAVELLNSRIMLMILIFESIMAALFSIIIITPISCGRRYGVIAIISVSVSNLTKLIIIMFTISVWKGAWGLCKNPLIWASTV